MGCHKAKKYDDDLMQVANMLKNIPKGKTFVLRVVEPLKAGFGKQPFSLSLSTSRCIDKSI